MQCQYWKCILARVEINLCYYDLKAVSDEQILAPRLGGLVAVFTALDFFNVLGSKCLSSDGASLSTNSATSIRWPNYAGLN